MRKKILCFALAAAMAMSVTACGAKKDSSSAASETSAAEASSAASAEVSANSSDSAEAVSEAAEAQTTGSAHLPFEDPGNTEKSDETCKIILGSEPSVLIESAAGTLEQEAEVVANAMLDRLVRVDEQTGDVIPGLAKSWEWVDGTHCRFNLRDDVTMSDGTPLVADDVVYTVSVWLDKCSSNDIGQYIDPEGAVADDEHTVTIAFNTAAPDLLVLIAGAGFGIYSEDEVEAAGGIDAVARNPVIGSGRYKFKEWENGQYITLERNEEYWDPDYTGYFKELRISFIPDSSSRIMSVLSGDAEVTYDIPVTEASAYTEKPEVKTYIYPINAVSHLWFNMGENGNEALKDEKVRKAIDLVLDYEALNQVATVGYGEIQTGYFHNNEKMHSDTYTTDELAVDLEGAKALLEEAGYKAGDIKLRLVIIAKLQPMAVVVQSCLAQIGIEVAIETPDVPAFVQAAAGGDYDLALVGDTTGARYPTVMHSIRNAGVYGFSIAGPKWTTDDIDAAIQAAIEEPDEAKAREMFGEIENQFKDMTLLCNVYEEMHCAVTSADIKGYGIMEREYMDITTLYK